MKLEVGNLGKLDTNGTGWLIGFSDWCKDRTLNLRYIPKNELSTGPHIKWFHHPAGHPNGEAKPISLGKTMSVLVSTEGEFKLEFCTSADFAEGFTRSVILRRHGDFAIWGEGLFHRAFGIAPATIMTIRWETAT